MVHPQEVHGRVAVVGQSLDWTEGPSATVQTFRRSCRQIHFRAARSAKVVHQSRRVVVAVVVVVVVAAAAARQEDP